MNKEIETLINNLEGCVGMFDYMLTPIENDLLLSYINELQQENKELHNKIDKGIEYLETNGYGYDCCGDMCYFLDEENQKELLEILKESEVNECQ